MADPELVAATEPTPPPAETTPEADSLLDHAAEFHGAKGFEAAETPEGKAPKAVAAMERDKDGKFVRAAKRHSAKSVATPADVPRIAELTKKLREAERERDEWKSRVSTPVKLPPESVTPSVKSSAESVTAPPTEPFTEPKPTPESLLAEGIADPYGTALVEAVLEWRARKAEHEKAQAAKVTEQQTADADYRAKKAAYDEAAAKYFDAHPDGAEKIMATFKAIPKEFGMTPLLHRAIVEDLAHGPQIGYALAQDLDFYAQILLETDGKEPTDQAAALLRRRLLARVQAAPTGSAAATSPRPLAPRPPNPVRTGPMTTGDELPGDASSLKDHAKAFLKRR